MILLFWCAEQVRTATAKKLIDKYNLKKVCSIVQGGKERYDSVYNGLKEIARLEIADEDAYVYIHDGARPCVDAELLNECKTNVEVYGACVPAVHVKDTIKIVDSYGFSADTPKRSSLMAVQTPQCFRFIDALKAYSDMENTAAGGADAALQSTRRGASAHQRGLLRTLRLRPALSHVAEDLVRGRGISRLRPSPAGRKRPALPDHRRRRHRRLPHPRPPHPSKPLDGIKQRYVQRQGGRNRRFFLIIRPKACIV